MHPPAVLSRQSVIQYASCGQQCCNACADIPLSKAVAEVRVGYLEDRGCTCPCDKPLTPAMFMQCLRRHPTVEGGGGGASGLFGGQRTGGGAY